MKKITIVSILSLVFLLLCSLVAFSLRYVAIYNPWVLLVIGIAILLISGIIALISKKILLLNVLCFIMNSIALGFCIRSWYVFRGFDNSFWIMCLVSLACVVYLLIFYLLLYIPFINRHFNVYLWIFLILTLIIYILVIIFTKTTYVSTFGYYVIIEMSFIFAMCKSHKRISDLFRNVVISTYSVLVVAIIIALLMLECDGLDFDLSGVDISINSPKGKKVKNIIE